MVTSLGSPTSVSMELPFSSGKGGGEIVPRGALFPADWSIAILIGYVLIGGIIAIFFPKWRLRVVVGLLILGVFLFGITT